MLIRQLFSNLFVPSLFWGKKASQEGASQETCLFIPPLKWASPWPITGAIVLDKRNHSKEVMGSKNISCLQSRGRGEVSVAWNRKHRQYLGCRQCSALGGTFLDGLVQPDHLFKLLWELTPPMFPLSLLLKWSLSLCLALCIHSACVLDQSDTSLQPFLQWLSRLPKSLIEVIIHVLLCCKENVNIIKGVLSS